MEQRRSETGNSSGNPFLAESAFSPGDLIRAAEGSRDTSRPIRIVTVPEGEIVVIHCPSAAHELGDHPRQPTFAGNTPEVVEEPPELLEDIGGRTFVEVCLLLGKFPSVVYEPHRNWLFVAENTTEWWKGFVLDVQEESLTVRLTDPTGKTQDIEGELPLGEVTELELPYVAKGVVFDIFFGVSRNAPPGKREIVFRKEQWAEEELRRAQEEADSIRERLGWR